MARWDMRAALFLALVLAVALPRQIQCMGRRMLESQDVGLLPGKVEVIETETEWQEGPASVSVTVKLAEATADGMLPVEGIEIGAWVYDPWANLMPEQIGRKALLYSPELFGEEGVATKVPLGPIPEQFKASQEAGHLLYFLKIEDVHDCCRYAYSMEYVSFHPEQNLELLLTPQLAPAVCNSLILCQPEGAYSVSLNLKLDAEPVGGFQPQEGLNVSIYAYNLTKWPEGGVVPTLVATKTLLGSESLPIAEPILLDFVFMLPSQLAAASLDEVAVYAAVLSLNSSRYNYFGFQPLHQFTDEPVAFNAKLTGTSAEVSVMSSSNLSLADLPPGLFPEIKTPEVILPEVDPVVEDPQVPAYSPPQQTVFLNVTVDEAPFDGFMEGEGVVVTVWAFFDATAIHDSAEPVGSAPIKGSEGLLKAGAIAEIALDLSPLNLSSDEELTGLEYYVTLSSPLECCRYVYHEAAYTQVSANTKPTSVLAVLDTEYCSKDICSLTATKGVSAQSVMPSLSMVSVILEIDGTPPGGFEPEEGILLTIWAQISLSDPLLENFAGEPVEVSRMLVIPANDTDINEVMMPLDFSMASDGLLTAVTEKTAKMWATVSTPRCCRYEAFYMFGLANIDPKPTVPEVSIKADIDSEPCNEEVLCTVT